VPQQRSLMNVSVIIPAYNASNTIKETLDSVLCQSALPEEILVLDDGSTDNTASIVGSFGPRVTLLAGNHDGAAAARNLLCSHARNELVAFLDADDVWHSRYLEFQLRLFQKYPAAVASFFGHVNFHGYGNWRWETDPSADDLGSESMTPLEFLQRYNQAPGPFSSMSYCCIPRQILRQLGKEPFQANGAEDSYLFNLLPLFGSVIYSPSPLVAYRITNESLSSDRLMCIGARVKAFELLLSRYEMQSASNLRPAFWKAFASHRRLYSKLLMSAGRTAEARRQLRHSFENCSYPQSVAKSLALLFLSYLPGPLQPNRSSALLRRNI
jgi:glycosyltransferase involved in cell wall biosynthesis